MVMALIFVGIYVLGGKRIRAGDDHREVFARLGPVGAASQGRNSDSGGWLGHDAQLIPQELLGLAYRGVVDEDNIIDIRLGQWED